jgi:hypothetical protein
MVDVVAEVGRRQQGHIPVRRVVDHVAELSALHFVGALHGRTDGVAHAPRIVDPPLRHNQLQV